MLHLVEDLLQGGLPGLGNQCATQVLLKGLARGPGPLAEHLVNIGGDILDLNSGHGANTTPLRRHGGGFGPSVVVVAGGVLSTDPAYQGVDELVVGCVEVTTAIPGWGSPGHQARSD